NGAAKHAVNIDVQRTTVIGSGDVVPGVKGHGLAAENSAAPSTSAIVVDQEIDHSRRIVEKQVVRLCASPDVFFAHDRREESEASWFDPSFHGNGIRGIQSAAVERLGILGGAIQHKGAAETVRWSRRERRIT